MRAILMVIVLVGCRSETTVPDVDGGIEPDGPPLIDFFGEACEPAFYPGAIASCRGNDGACIDQGDSTGVCRPWCQEDDRDWNKQKICEGSTAGGVPTWTSDGTTTELPFVCYCAPP